MVGSHQVKILLKKWQITVTSAVLAIALVATFFMSSSRSGDSTQPTTITPVQTWSGPASIVSGAIIDGANQAIALVNTGDTANLQVISLSSNKTLGIKPMSNAANAVTFNSHNTLAVGHGTGRAGSISFYQYPGLRLLSTIPMAGPVRQVSAAVTGNVFSALIKVGVVVSAAVVNSATHATLTTIPLPSNTTAIALSPDGLMLYAAISTGKVLVFSTSTNSQLYTFAAGGAFIAMSASSDGTSLYGLKTTTSGENVSVVDLATQAVVSVLPAPKATKAIQVSARGNSLFDFVGTEKYGNIQSFSTNR